MQVEDADFENIPRLGAADVDGASQDMDPEALSRAAAMNGGIHGPGAAAVDSLVAGCPGEYAFRARVALDHAFGVVVGMMGEGLQRHEIAGIHIETRLEVLAEVAPVNRVGIRREQVVASAIGRRLAFGLCERRHGCCYREDQRGRKKRQPGQSPQMVNMHIVVPRLTDHGSWLSESKAAKPQPDERP